MRFEREIDIHSPKEKVWRFLWDVDRFIACVPGCKEAGTVEPGKSYTATMVEKVGPFRVEFPMRIDVLESRELSYIKAQASGSDSSHPIARDVAAMFHTTSIASPGALAFGPGAFGVQARAHARPSRAGTYGLNFMARLPRGLRPVTLPRKGVERPGGWLSAVGNRSYPAWRALSRARRSISSGGTSST